MEGDGLFLLTSFHFTLLLRNALFYTYLHLLGNHFLEKYNPEIVKIIHLQMANIQRLLTHGPISYLEVVTTEVIEFLIF